MFEGGLPFTRTRTAPTGYEKVRMLFHGIRCIQLLSSIIVGSILIWFAWWLTHDRLGLPWTFIILLVSSFLTVIILTATLCFHCLTGLNPRLNLVLNSSMLFLWALGFSFLTYWSYNTLKSSCSIAQWQDADGVKVCECYKGLFSFALFGLLSTAAALGLDVHIYRLSSRFGKHTRLDNLETKPRTVVDARGPYADAHNARSVEGMDDYPSRHSDAFEVPSAGYGANPAQKKPLMQYGQDDAFDFDTGYHGGHEERVLGTPK
ncbi:hypothetical protein CAC42_2177 [Sphaceloma murrayae]|uniref:MARVEL domain-containing protein n=1 Tax=Sphaceloma murrayae TaxID=2082308 RepID=A0A2K1QIF0_9PEZI|nr:hypothetical protein CAC42_2177 [Sphaceloma murrayae]